MKENKYDDEIFYKKYMNFPRSAKGLEAAGEWRELKKLLPDFSGKRVLDIGCGLGWHCAYAAQNGASYVLGVDISRKMLEGAIERNSWPCVEYKMMAMEDLTFPRESFDVVISSLALHYTPRFEDVCARVFSTLRPGGSFVFSAEHPVFTAGGAQEWVYDDAGQIKHWPVDNYFLEGRRNTLFLGEKVTKYHRTLSTYISALLYQGFVIKGFCEPSPGAEMIKAQEGMADELRRPMMMIVAAEKP